MANNTYITEAFNALNKMPRMHDSKKSLKESSRRGLKESDDIEVLYRKNGEWIPKKDLEEDMSPEDAEDTQVLRNIQLKMRRRPSSARLNKKELAVLDKYGLSYDKDSAVLRYTKSGAPFYGVGNLRGFLRSDPRKQNLADGARKQQDRQLARRGTDNAVFDARNRYWDMEIALDNRNRARKDLDKINNKTDYLDDYPYPGPVSADSLGRWVGSIKSGREYARNSAQDRLDKSQKEINKLLRRDESLTESEGSEIIAQYSIDVYQDTNMSTEKMEKLIMDILQNNGLTVAGCMSTDTSWNVEDYYG